MFLNYFQIMNNYKFFFVLFLYFLILKSIIEALQCHLVWNFIKLVSLIFFGHALLCFSNVNCFMFQLLLFNFKNPLHSSNNLFDITLRTKLNKLKPDNFILCPAREPATVSSKVKLQYCSSFIKPLTETIHLGQALRKQVLPRVWKKS